MTSGSNWRHLNRPATEGERTISAQLIRPLLRSCNTSLRLILSNFLRRLRIRRCSPISQSRGCSRWTAGKSAKQGERRPPPNTLAKPAAAIIRDRLAGIAQYSVEELLVVLGKLVAFFFLLAFGKQCVGVKVMPNVAPATLNELCGQPAPVLFIMRAAQIVREIDELRIEHRKQRAKRAFIPAVRCRCN
jgi:hypothetical protein